MTSLDIFPPSNSESPVQKCNSPPEEMSSFEVVSNESFNFSEFCLIPEQLPEGNGKQLPEGKGKQLPEEQYFTPGEHFSTPEEVQPSTIDLSEEEIQKRVFELIEDNKSLKESLQSSRAYMKSELCAITSWHQSMTSSIAQQKIDLQESQAQVQQLEREKAQLLAKITEKQEEEPQKDTESLKSQLKDAELKVFCLKQEIEEQNLKDAENLKKSQLEDAELNISILKQVIEEQNLKIEGMKQKFEVNEKEKNDLILKLKNQDELISKNDKLFLTHAEEYKAQVNVLKKGHEKVICNLDAKVRALEEKLNVERREKEQRIKNNLEDKKLLSVLKSKYDQEKKVLKQQSTKEKQKIEIIQTLLGENKKEKNDLLLKLENQDEQISKRDKVLLTQAEVYEEQVKVLKKGHAKVVQVLEAKSNAWEEKLNWEMRDKEEQRGKFAALENVSCRLKPGCREHPPWPQGICTKCQPNALTLNRQTYRHVDNIVFENAQVVERFLEGWRGTGQQRAGLLYGFYEVHKDVPLGIKATVTAIYEPPQDGSRDYLRFLPDERASTVDHIAKELGLSRVGWIFTDLVAEDTQKGTVRNLRNINSHFLSAQECIMAGHFQNEHPNPCRLSPEGYFGSKFVTICFTGDAEQNAHMEGYQVSNQCMALVRDGCLLPTLDAPELGYVRESTGQQFVPDVFYKVKDSYGNEVTRIARPLPIEYLLVDVPVSTPNEPHFTFYADPNIKPFPVENRLSEAQDFPRVVSYLRQFGPDQFLEAMSDFHLLLYLATMDLLPLMEDLGPLLTAVKLKDRQMATEWSTGERWATVEHLMHSQGSPGGPGGASEAGTDGGSLWICRHCTFLNQPHSNACEICSLPQ